MSTLTRHAGWLLAATFAFSFAYELYRATAKRDASRHDTVRALVLQLPMYAVAASLVAGLVTGQAWAAWLGLAFTVVMILVSTCYYNPVILLERKPTLLDWVEDLAFTGLLFVIAALLAYEVAGYELSAG